MEDLFREEDFVQEKKFRPWRYVFIYYIIALLHLGMFTVSVGKTIILPQHEYWFYAYRVWIIMSVVFPLFLAFAMVFFNKKMISLPLKTIFFSLLGLGSTYLFGFLLLSLADRMERKEPDPDDIRIPICLAGFITLLYCIIILPLARYKQKRKVSNGDYS